MAAKFNFMLSMALFISSCTSETDSLDHQGRISEVPQMSVYELKNLQKSDESFYLFDVREEWERKIARIEGSRLLNEETVDFINTLDPDSLMVFQCRTGGRSQAAAEYFRQRGFTRVFNLAGGIDAWSVEIDPSVARYSRKSK